ncbi:amidohydrolase family protein [Desulfobacterium sp. N47]
MKYDLIIHNGIIVTVNKDFEIIKDGIVFINDGKIEEVSSKPKDFVFPQAKEIIDAAGGIIMPGLVNTHTHLPMTILRGIGDDLLLSEWLNNYIFPLEAKYMNPETVRIASCLGCAEMLLSGTTTCCDGYFHEEEVAQAVLESKMRAVLGQGVIDFPAPGIPDPAQNIKTAARYVEKWQNISSLIKPSIFCHSPYTCSENTLKKAKQIASSNNILFQIHAAETKDEFDTIMLKHSVSPLKYIEQTGILDENTLLVHAVWIDGKDIKIISNHNSKVSHNPQSNMKLASGISPVPQLLKEKITVGLGTDSCASNNDPDMFKEMDVAAKLHKVNTYDPTVMDAKTVVQMATIKGAEAIGLGNETGSIEKGKQADIIIIDTDSFHLIPMYNPVSHIVYSATGSDVRDVIVAGKPVVRDKKLLTMNTEEIIDRINHLACRIKKDAIMA